LRCCAPPGCSTPSRPGRTLAFFAGAPISRAAERMATAPRRRCTPCTRRWPSPRRTGATPTPARQCCPEAGGQRPCRACPGGLCTGGRDANGTRVNVVRAPDGAPLLPGRPHCGARGHRAVRRVGQRLVALGQRHGCAGHRRAGSVTVSDREDKLCRWRPPSPPWPPVGRNRVRSHTSTRTSGGETTARSGRSTCSTARSDARPCGASASGRKLLGLAHAQPHRVRLSNGGAQHPPGGAVRARRRRGAAGPRQPARAAVATRPECSSSACTGAREGGASCTSAVPIRAAVNTPWFDQVTIESRAGAPDVDSRGAQLVRSGDLPRARRRVDL
jgi:hypothetical protein